MFKRNHVHEPCDNCKSKPYLLDMRVILMDEYGLPDHVKEELYCRNCTWLSRKDIKARLREQLVREELQDSLEE